MTSLRRPTQGGAADLAMAQKAALVAAVGIATFLGVLGLRYAGALQGGELALHDRSVSAAATDRASWDVAVVPISEDDLADWGWPISDARLADIVYAALNAGAVAVGIDIYRDHPVPPGSQRLAAVLGDPRVVAIYKLGAPAGDGGSVGAAEVSPPAAGAERAGFSDVPLDPDGVVRRALLVVADDGGVHQSLALRLAGIALGGQSLRGQPGNPDVLMIGETPYPRLPAHYGPYSEVDSNGYQIALDFRHRPATIPRLSAKDLISDGTDLSRVAGKVVLAGIASASVKDEFRTSRGGGGDKDASLGVEIHAAAVQQLLDVGRGLGTPLRAMPPKFVALCLLGATLIGSAAALMVRSTLAAILLGPVVALVLALALDAGAARGLWLPALPVSLGWLAAFLGTATVLAMIVRARQVTLDRLFSSHLSPELAREIWRNRAVLLAGRRPVPARLFTTVLFADLAGSTHVGGTAEPGAFMDWIGICLARLGAVAQNAGGFVEKYTGDGIMVVFGAPVPSLSESERQHDALRACACALAMGDAVRELNAGGPGLAPYRLRIGLHSGLVHGGTIGVAGSLRYNIIGDTANFAARVEAYGKRLPDAASRDMTICMTETTESMVRGEVLSHPLGRLSHDDGQHAAEIFELTGIGAGIESRAKDAAQ